MEKNIAAFLDSTAYTISVSFTSVQPSGAKGKKKYTYICNLPGVKVGDWVVVDAPDFDGDAQIPLRAGEMRMEDLDSIFSGEPTVLKGMPKLVLVTGVDKDVAIEPNAPTTYGWVISKLDMTAYQETLRRNNQVTGLVADAYKASMRKSFAERILGDMAEGDKSKLLSLLAPKTI
jgi:hypothetical protein